MSTWSACQLLQGYQVNEFSKGLDWDWKESDSWVVSLGLHFVCHLYSIKWGAYESEGLG